jgi:hypothetical protein
MSVITKEVAREMLMLWLDAERAVTTGKSYTIGTRSLTRANISEIAERIKFWRNELEKLESGRGSGMRVFRAVPRDF